MWEWIVFGIQTVMELTSNIFTLLIGGPIFDVITDPIDIIMSGFLAWTGGGD